MTKVAGLLAAAMCLGVAGTLGRPGVIAAGASVAVGAMVTGMLEVLRRRVKQEGLLIVLGRFLAGKPWHGKPITNAGWSRKGTRALTPTGHASWFWHQTGKRRFAQRSVSTLLVLLAVLGLIFQRRQTEIELAILAVPSLVIGALWAWDYWGRRKHHRAWIVPLHKALSGEVGWPVALPAKDWLTVSPDRSFVRVQVPVEFKGIVHELQRVDRIVSMRLALEAPIARWDLGGASPHVIYTASKPPPNHVPVSDIIGEIKAAKPEVMVFGRGKKRQIVATSLALDSPSVGISMPAGAGKSSMLRLLLSQMLFKGCLVMILDWKMLSHSWAFGCPNVWYAGEIEEIHDALCWLEDEITRRKRAARSHAMKHGGRSGHVWSEDVVGPRLLVCCEEANVTSKLLRDYWHWKRLPKEPKSSPAIRGLEQGVFSGREFAVNAFISGQMLSHRAAMSSEARENMGTRILGWYTSNNWRMLAPEHPMPPRTRHHEGLVQVVSSGTVSETQVGWIEDEEAHELALSGAVARWPAIDATATVPSAKTLAGPADVIITGQTIKPTLPLIGLADAAERKIVPSVSTARMDRHRDKAGFPPYRDQKGTELLYDPLELAAYYRQKKQSRSRA